LKSNRNCALDFSSFEMDNKKINYEQWYSARTQKIQKKIDVRNEYGAGDGNGKGKGGGAGRGNGKPRGKGKGGGGGRFGGRGRWGKK
jgi:hypothetical protein